jgi:hypothetical protein
MKVEVRYILSYLIMIVSYFVCVCVLMLGIKPGVSHVLDKYCISAPQNDWHMVSQCLLGTY